MTNRERQDCEFEVIESIFGSDVLDLRVKDQGWRPLHLKLHLTPLQESLGKSEIYAKCTLHIICASKYPKVPPKIFLEDTKGLSNHQIDELLKELQDQTQRLKGDEVIYELAQTIQAFLLKYNKPSPGNLYDEMLLQNAKRDQERIDYQKKRESLEQKAIKDEIEKRKEILKNESRIRRDTRSVSESSPTHGNSVSMDLSNELTSPTWPYFRSHMYPNECIEHRHSDKIFFTNVGRQIQKGCCLGHSQKGCVAYSGIDLESGQLLYITEWVVKYDELDKICQSNCQPVNKDGSGDGRRCSLHNVDDIVTTIEKQVTILSQLRHKNLINYECVLCLKKKDFLLIYLVQDFVFGTSVYSISGTLGWCAEGASIVAKGVLDAIIYLHNNSIFHNQLIDTTVFMDNTGTIRVTDYALVPYLQELIGGPKANKNDLPAMGALIESLLPTHHADMRDYIERCKSDRTLTAVELRNHPFLQPVLVQPNTPKVEVAMDQLQIREHKELHANLTTAQSRLENEFEFLQFLGKGAYGDVLKVRNMLDNRQYAIKRIPLTARNKQLYKKIRREVELLSRLNHENVVRYYNSWIEVGLPSTEFGQEEMQGDFSMSIDSHNPRTTPALKNASDESSSDESSDDWINCVPPVDPDSSDGIEFVNSDGECVQYAEEEDNQSNGSDNKVKRLKSPRMDQYMYIQMEFCEKKTLRTAIDSGLNTDKERLWRLFREIAEGLAHIHQQGMIHRDLKPVNIFLDMRDQVKIGDFGLATTSFLALQNQDLNLSIQPNHSDLADTLTGNVGTALYVAPELTGNASKSTYNNKVDLYSLGIILFEMSVSPFSTGMERVATIHGIRTPEIKFPNAVINDQTVQQNVKVIRWLLDHNPGRRPSAEELLSSDLIPPPRLEATELQEMLRNVLANPQSKTYKHLVSRCLSQHNDQILELTYHLGLGITSNSMEYVKSRVTNLLRLHGAVEVMTPLLTPLDANHCHHNSVKLMTHSGCVVYLPYDFRIPFARHVAINGITSIRRYSIGRVYREKKVFNFHPKQLYECAFDIINQNPGNLIADAETIAICFRICDQFPILKEKNLSIRLNHSSLLRAILLYCNVPKNKYIPLFTSLAEFMEGKLSKFQLTSTINGMFSTMKSNTNNLIDMLLTECPMGAKKNLITGHSLRSLLNGRGEAASLAKGAIRELDHVVQLCLWMGVSCPITLHTGVSVPFERVQSGIVWQFVADLKITKRRNLEILALGGRYDELLAGFQKMAKSGSITVPDKNLCGVGFSLALDKLIYSLGPSFGHEYQSIDVVVCVTGSRPPLQDVTQILKALWHLKIRSGVIEAHTSEEAENAAKDLGASTVIVLGEGGSLRVSSWDQKIYKDQQVTRPELMEYLRKLNCVEVMESSTNIGHSGGSYSSNNSSSGAPNPNYAYSNKNSSQSVPDIEVVFYLNDRPVANAKRRLENQILQQMESSLDLFNKRERIKIYALEISMSALGAFVVSVDRREMTKKSNYCEEELSRVIERFPRYKKLFISIHSDIVDDLTSHNSNNSHPPIIGLYSTTDNCYRIVI